MSERLEAPQYEDYHDENGDIDMDTWMNAINEYQRADAIYRFEKAVKEEMGISDDDWSETPDSIKQCMINMWKAAEEHANIMYELEDWRDSMPI